MLRPEAGPGASAPTGESRDTAIAIACPPILEIEITGFGRSSILKLKLLCCTPRASWLRLRDAT